jgi:sugar/nucleoside kinase (ribokinase family)
VVGIGNALVDVLSKVEDAFLIENGVEKGIMTLIDTARASELYGRMGPATEISGGSGANTIAGLAMLGSRAAYVGKVKDDQLGRIFAHDIRALGATFETPMAKGDHDHETGRCMVLVSPDGERSMNTYLGISEFLSPSDIDEEMMGRADWLYLEGYRFDGPDSHEAFARAIAACKRGGGRASVTLSDPFCVDRHRDAFRRMIRDDLDLLFANEHEVMSLYQTASLEEALDACAAEVHFAAVTVGPGGAWVIQDGARVLVPTAAAEVVDATGAGDMFAAGFLHGLAGGRSPEICAAMGCVAAGEIIGHIGARPEVDLKALMAGHGF